MAATQAPEQTPTATGGPPPRPRRARTGMREALRALSTVLIVAGALLIADAGLTVAWQEPVSAFLAQRSQDALSGDLNALERSGVTPLEQRTLRALPTDTSRIAFLARSLRRRAHPGSAVGRITIPSIGARFVLVDGTGAPDLRKGPGLYPQTPFPGVPGTTAIAGHRTTYLAPFRHVDRLRRGDAIVVTMPYARFTYRVEGTRIVTPDSMQEVIHRTGYTRLALTACNPLYSAAQRLVVFARLQTTQPLGSAARAA
jgi:sortase A